MQNKKILLLESNRGQARVYSQYLTEKQYHVEVIRSGAAATRLVSQFLPDLIIIDTAGFQSETRLCRTVRRAFPEVPVLVLLSEKKGPITAELADEVLYPGFTLRKVLNAVNRLLPANSDDWMLVLGIRLSLSTRRVQFQKREKRLTPKQVALLALFLKSPNQLITRQELLKQIWETDYMGDMRTLDVHISWLRRELVKLGNTKVSLRTKRGLGYVLQLVDEIEPTEPVLEEIDIDAANAD
jgi:DNA-binding response OmpR family regulator